MPAITLRSTQITLQSCCDHRTNHPAIRRRSSAITLCSIPPYPWADRSPALGRWARRFGDPKKGRDARVGKAPRCRHVRSNAEISAGRRCIMRSPGRRSNSLRTQLTGRALPRRFPPPHGPSLLIGKVLIALLNCDRHPICPNHVASIATGFSRALSHELQHSWKQTRARGSGPILCQIPMVWLDAIQDRGGRGKIPRSLPNFMCSLSFAAAPGKISGVLSENFVGHC